jgi:hypothetical protein
MGLLDETRFIERQQFFNGQRLFATDLQGLEAFNREMRWLHNQSLHQPGIGNGFAVSGKKGDREVTIGPGYAIDAKGREIVLTETRKEPVPPVAGEADGSPASYDLTVSYPADEDLEEAETRGGICNSHGVVRRREEPEFCWVPLQKDETGRLSAVGKLGEDIKKGLRIVLARAEVLNCQLDSAPSVAQRRSARPSKQPYIACGEVKPDPWTIHWFIDKEDLEELLTEALTRIVQLSMSQLIAMIVPGTVFYGRVEALHAGVISQTQLLPILGPFILPLGIEASIDTSRAGFLTTPHHIARIAGLRTKTINLVELAERLGLVDLDELAEVLQGADGGPEFVEQLRRGIYISLFIDGLVNIEEPHPDGFTVCLGLMVQLIDISDLRFILGAPESLKELLTGYIREKIQQIGIVQELTECVEKKKKEPQECIEEAVETVIELIEEYFWVLFVREDWYVVWMGVEG